MFFTLLLIVIFVLSYFAIVKHLSHWRRKGVPQYTVSKILKDSLNIFTNNLSLAETLEKYCKEFSDYRYFGIFQWFQKILIVNDVELIKDITIQNSDHFVDHDIFYQGNDPLWDRNLIVLRGTEWKRMRSVVSPFFTSSRMRTIFGLLLNCARQFVDHFEEQLHNQACVTLNVEDAYERFTSDAILSVAFGCPCDSFKSPKNDFYVNSHLLRPPNTFWGNLRFVLICRVTVLAKFFGLRAYSRAGRNFFLNYLGQRKKEGGSVRHDMIYLLNEAKTNDLKITDVDVAAQLLGLLFAGVETTSSSLSFMTYELAVHSEIQKRLQKEIDDTAEECNGNITYEALKKMKYLDMVVLETLRKWPSSSFTDRLCTKPYIIQARNSERVPLHLNKGDIVWIPFFHIQRDPKLFPNPERFDPERFNKQNVTKMNKYAYMPFGSGPRTCVAKPFGLLMLKLLMVQILSKFDITIVDKTVVPVRLAKLSTMLLAEGGMWLGLKLRHSQ